MKYAGLGISAILVFLLPQLAFGFAPAPVGIFIEISPSSQDMAPGSEAIFTIAVSSVEGYEGSITLLIEDQPEGVSVAFESDSVQVESYAVANVQMTVTMAPEVTAGIVEISIKGEDETEPSIFSTGKVMLNISGEPITTATTASTTATTASTTATTASTTTTVSTTPPGGVIERTVTSTTTKITTTTVISWESTNTPEIIRTTTIEKPVQASDLTIPTVTLIVVVSLLVLAGFTLRRSNQ